MRSYRTTRRAAAIAVTAALAAGLLAGCASDDGDDSAKDTGGDSSGKTTLNVGLFGVFGYQEAGLYAEYEKLHPNIKIKQTTVERNENYYPALLTHLSAGSGLSDIQGIEIANIAEITSTQADKFMDLSKVEGASKDNFFPWKAAQGSTKDGKLIGLGTDIGPMALCYRKDLFEAAGLPTDRDKVAELWKGDWKKWVDAGNQYKAKAPKGTAWTDGAAGVFNAAISSSATRYVDDSGNYIYKDNPDVRAAFDLAADAAANGLTAKTGEPFTEPWNQAIANGKFATISCPAWMLGTLKDKGGDKAKGKWDIAVPPKGGNWGGSFLGVPEAGKNKEEAAKLAAWLTAPEQQAKLFAKQGSFPSSPQAAAMPEIKTAKNDYFPEVPYGEIFSATAADIPVQVIGAKDQTVQENFVRSGLLLVEQGKQDKDGAWDAAIKAIDNALDQ
ncbi:putative arabinose-binding protein [Streptomyces sp. RB5]|uniref:Putative arabinose-binding protein n=1 Tax=Streptomyces smaragdinus TaxID=2585196 RepID=A0A7K0CLK9_9ACTN|nr:extracellular solute-binding protein [Streptomyces smaragdinus]MQY13902.1 putative arabinose-binding protein [Streptomyces smaragdinus]